MSKEDPTEEELNAMIAEQLQCKPQWWDGSRDVDEHTGRCRECGRTMHIAAHGQCSACYRRQRRKDIKEGKR